MAENMSTGVVRDAVRHALVVVDSGKLDLTTASEQTLEVLRGMMVDAALEDLGMANPTAAQRNVLETAARNALNLAISGRNNGASMCVLPKEE